MLAGMLAAFTAPVLAQSKECNDENKAAWYDTFLKNYKGEPPQQKIAYDAAKLYLTSCPEDPNDKIADFMKNKFVIPYEKLTTSNSVKKQFEDAYTNKKYADQLRLGKEIISTEPDNSSVYIIMGLAGTGDPSLLAESSQFAKKAIELIETGKPFAPYDSKDKALAAMNYTVAEANLKTNPADAIPFFLKAAKYDSDLKKSYQLYYDLATAYEKGPGAVLTEKYRPFVGKDETDESKLVKANLNQIVDRQIDALARAAALATDANTKKAIMDDLTALYKYRNNSDAGLNELVAGILNKPLPEIPTPLTSLPTPAPGSTPAGTPGTNGGAPAGTPTSNTKPAGTNSVTSTGTQKPAATGSTKPAPSPTPSPTPNRKPNFRRG